MNVEQELGIAWVLFHGDRLGKVAGLVDGAVFEAGDVVGEELEGHGAGDDGSVERAGGNGDVIVDGGNGFAVSLGHDAQDAGIAGLALGDVAKGFVFAGTIVAESDDGHVFL